jgi:hypothetical protein
MPGFVGCAVWSVWRSGHIVFHAIHVEHRGMGKTIGTDGRVQGGNEKKAKGRR